MNTADLLLFDQVNTAPPTSNRGQKISAPSSQSSGILSASLFTVSSIPSSLPQTSESGNDHFLQSPGGFRGLHRPQSRASADLTFDLAMDLAVTSSRERSSSNISQSGLLSRQSSAPSSNSNKNASSSSPASNTSTGTSASSSNDFSAYFSAPPSRTRGGSQSSNIPTTSVADGGSNRGVHSDKSLSAPSFESQHVPIRRASRESTVSTIDPSAPSPMPSFTSFSSVLDPIAGSTPENLALTESSVNSTYSSTAAAHMDSFLPLNSPEPPKSNSGQRAPSSSRRGSALLHSAVNASDLLVIHRAHDEDDSFNGVSHATTSSAPSSSHGADDSLRRRAMQLNHRRGSSSAMFNTASSSSSPASASTKTFQLGEFDPSSVDSSSVHAIPAPLSGSGESSALNRSRRRLSTQIGTSASSPSASSSGDIDALLNALELRK
jgi:hypothetical protein